MSDVCPLNPWVPDYLKNLRGKRNITNVVSYSDAHALEEVTDQLMQAKPLVARARILELRSKLQDVAKGNAFLFQGGDCAETFMECQESYLTAQLQLLHCVKERLEAMFQKPAVMLGRMAGQYAKPRTNAFDTFEGKPVPPYHGDLINGYALEERDPNPFRMLEGYACSDYTQRLMEGVKSPCYSSHEAFLLPYEAALMRMQTGDRYCASTHFPWIGYRNLMHSPDHVRLFETVCNPIGLKIGEDSDILQVMDAVKQLNPENHANKIVLIHRFPLKTIAMHLERWVQAFQDENLSVIWMCDPMHGNTQKENGMKYRVFSDISETVQVAWELHARLGAKLGGLHLEMTADVIQECPEHGNDLALSSKKYKSRVDPRLNAAQVLRLLDVLSACVSLA